MPVCMILFFHLKEIDELLQLLLYFIKLYFLIGDDGSGKTSLVTKLRNPGEDEIKKGSGLEFAYVDVHDEERDG